MDAMTPIQVHRRTPVLTLVSSSKYTPLRGNLEPKSAQSDITSAAAVTARRDDVAVRADIPTQLIDMRNICFDLGVSTP